MKEVAKNGFFPEKNNTNREFYPEMNLAVIHSGRHHSAAATLLQIGEANLELRPLTPLFPALSTDGEEWIDSERNLFAPVLNEKFAFLYTLLQHRWETEQKFKGFSDTPTN